MALSNIVDRCDGFRVEQRVQLSNIAQKVHIHLYPSPSPATLSLQSNHTSVHLFTSIQFQLCPLTLSLQPNQTSVHLFHFNPISTLSLLLPFPVTLPLQSHSNPASVTFPFQISEHPFTSTSTTGESHKRAVGGGSDIYIYICMFNACS